MYTISYVTMCRVSVPSYHRENNNLSWYFKQCPWSTPLPIVSPIFTDKIHPPAYKFKCYADICSASGYSYFHRFSFFSIENVLVHQSIAWANVNESGRSSIQFLKTIARLSGTILGLVQTNNFSRRGLKQKPEIKYTMTSLHSHALSRVWARAFAGVLSFFVDAISGNLSVVMVLLIFLQTLQLGVDLGMYQCQRLTTDTGWNIYYLNKVWFILNLTTCSDIICIGYIRNEL